MDIAVLGLGRLGRTLVPLLRSAGHRVTPWKRGRPIPQTDLLWLMVRDDAVAEVAALVPPGPIVLHASGALDVEVLRPHRPAGSLHLLQSFPGPEVATPPMKGVRAAIAGDAEAGEAATTLARSLGAIPVHVQGDRRLYHAAAVLAGNFATTLLAGAGRVLEDSGVDAKTAREMLLPLALASLQQAVEDPASALTGPLPRGDAGTVRGHLDALQSTHPEMADVYRQMGTITVEMLTESGHVSPEVAKELIRSME
jgi:predicted short-subunit dehydrogenase-like oxidoreductase (DUF2520 family)